MSATSLATTQANHDYDATPESGNRSVVRIPVDFLLVALVFFAAGLIATPFVIAQATLFFYQPYLLALVHTFTLGWVTASIMGVMYRYVPALTRSRLRFPGLAAVQLVLYWIGVCGMVAHFTLGIWVGMWSSAILVFASVLLFAFNLFPCLLPHAGRAAAETGILLAIVFLVAAAAWGTLVGLDKTYNFLGGDLLSNIGGHVAFAATGWVTLAICSVSYRMLPAFLWPAVTLPRAALWQLYALAAGAAGLSTVLLLRAPGAVVFAALVVAALLGYVAIILRIALTHRMPIGWTARHALVGTGWLIVVAALGLILVCLGSGTVNGNRVAGGFGVIGLMGWVSNLIIGMSYRLFPGFVARARSAAGWRAIPVARLGQDKLRRWICAVFNLGVAVAAIGLLLGSDIIAQAGTVLGAAGGVPYAVVTLWTLSYAYRKSAPGEAALA